MSLPDGTRLGISTTRIRSTHQNLYFLRKPHGILRPLREPPHSSTRRRKKSSPPIWLKISTVSPYCSCAGWKYTDGALSSKGAGCKLIPTPPVDETWNQEETPW
jgi:hypothetical protein